MKATQSLQKLLQKSNTKWLGSIVLNAFKGIFSQILILRVHLDLG